MTLLCGLAVYKNGPLLNMNVIISVTNIKCGGKEKIAIIYIIKIINNNNIIVVDDYLII